MIKKKRKLLLLAPSLFCLANLKKYEDPMILKINQENPALLYEVLKKSPELKNQVYRPNLTVINSHLVTWLTGIATGFHKEIYNRIKYDREIFKLSDGGQIALDSMPKNGQNGKLKNNKDKPLVIMIPGLLNCIDDHFIHTLIDILEENDYEWKVINYRGLKTNLTTGKPFDTVDFQSFQEPLYQIVNDNKEKQIFLVGTSLGGNTVLKLLSDYGFDDTSIKAVVSVNPCLDLNKSQQNLTKALYGFYDFWFVFQFKKMHQRQNDTEILRKHFNENVKKQDQEDFDQIWKKSKTMSDMWHNYTRHVFNHQTFEETTKNGSAINSIDKIKNTKVFIIKSMNDPIIGNECIDEDRVLKNPNIILGKTNYGGHVGYYQNFFDTRQFHNNSIIHFLNAFRD